ncbi:MAG: ankyrin repeat domain-containing protein [Janthinobacterium lividum]
MNEADYNRLVEEQGWTPLLEACSAEDYEAVLKLIQSGADVNVVDKFGTTPLERAVRNAYENEDAAAKIVSLLLDNKANINAQNNEGVTALMQTAIYNYVTIARMLIERGADVNLRWNDGNTVISVVESIPSLARKRKRMIKMLEDAGGVR